MKSKNLNANKLADMLEQKAKTLREKGLTDSDMKSASGGGCRCCGSSCSQASALCEGQNNAWSDDNGNACRYSCIASSQD